VPPPRPVPPSGSFNPSAVLAAHGHAPRLPGSRSPVCVTWELRGFFHAANALGILPTEPSPSEEPCRLSTASCSLAVRLSGSVSGATSRSFRARFPPRAGWLPRPLRPCGLGRRDESAGIASSSVRQTARPPPACANGCCDDRSFPSGSPARGPVARFEALLSSEVRSRENRAARLLELAPEPRSPLGPRAVALLGLRPSEAFSTTVSGPVCREARLASFWLALRSPEDHAPFRNGTRRFDPEA